MAKKQDPQLLRRLQDEYTESFSHLDSRKTRWSRQLVLMNNLRRGDENIASTALFSYFNRVFSNLYDDKIQVKFHPSMDSEFRACEMLNRMAENDYREMDKPRLDYDWLWDACFYGRGYCETLNFSPSHKIMKPGIINPLVMFYDPFFANPHDWRYYGAWVLKSKTQIDRLSEEGVVNKADFANIAQGVEAKIWEYKIRTENAKEGNPTSNNTASTNSIWQLMEFKSYDEDGDKCIFWLDKDFTKVLRQKKLKELIGKEEHRWPIVIKEIFREPHSSLPVSVPDIIEDKHRALNVLYNLSYLAAKDEANPIYTYDQDRIKDVTQLFQRQISQHIPTEGDPTAAISPLRRSPAMSTSLMSFIQMLKTESAESIGTAQVSQPLQRGKKTATESALLQQIADLTQSLQSKVIANGEKEFWSHWWRRYQDHAEEIGEKVISLTNASGITFETIKMDDVKTKFPPNVLIMSAKEAEYKEMIERREMASQFPVISKALDQKGLQDFMKNVYFPKFGTMDTATLDIIFPKSIDELTAEAENEMLAAEKPVLVSETEDDEVHLYVHYRAKNTPEKWAHILAHELQRARKINAEKEQAKQQELPQNKQETIQPGEAATPLADEMTRNPKPPNMSMTPR